MDTLTIEIRNPKVRELLNSLAKPNLLRVVCFSVREPLGFGA